MHRNRRWREDRCKPPSSERGPLERVVVRCPIHVYWSGEDHHISQIRANRTVRKRLSEPKDFTLFDGDYGDHSWRAEGAIGALRVHHIRFPSFSFAETDHIVQISAFESAKFQLLTPHRRCRRKYQITSGASKG